MPHRRSAKGLGETAPARRRARCSGQSPLTLPSPPWGEREWLRPLDAERPRRPRPHGGGGKGSGRLIANGAQAPLASGGGNGFGPSMPNGPAGPLWHEREREWPRPLDSEWARRPRSHEGERMADSIDEQTCVGRLRRPGDQSVPGLAQPCAKQRNLLRPGGSSRVLSSARSRPNPWARFRTGRGAERVARSLARRPQVHEQAGRRTCPLSPAGERCAEHGVGRIRVVSPLPRGGEVRGARRQSHWVVSPLPRGGEGWGEGGFHGMASLTDGQEAALGTSLAVHRASRPHPFAQSLPWT